MPRRETLLAKLHRQNDKLEKRCESQQRQIKDLERLIEKPPPLSPLAESVSIAVRRMREQYCGDEWIVSVRFCPEMFARCSLMESDGAFNLSYLACDLSRRIEYDVRRKIIEEVGKARGFGS
jgi:hypothetical protein